MLPVLPIAEGFAVVGEVDHHRVVGEPGLVQRVEHPAGILGERAHRRIIAGKGHAPAAIGLVEALRRGERVVRRIEALHADEGLAVRAALPEELDAAVGLHGRPVFPVHQPVHPVRDPGIEAFDILVEEGRVLFGQVPFADMGGVVVAGLHQVEYRLLHPRNAVEGVVDAIDIVDHAMAVRIDAGPHAGACRGADRPGRESLGEARAFGGEPVDPRRLGEDVAVAAERVGPLLVGEDQE
jgi:hypothetical protein